VITMEEFITVKEVAKELDLSLYTVREMLRTDKMPGYREGRKWRIVRSEYEVWKKLRRRRNQYPSSQEN
jgi:excisionase family DNA binding protein